VAASPCRIENIACVFTYLFKLMSDSMLMVVAMFLLHSDSSVPYLDGTLLTEKPKAAFVLWNNIIL
jgi:hypothetical protein